MAHHEGYWARIRSMSMHEKAERTFRLSARKRNATMSEVRRQNPELSEDEIAVAFIRRVYGDTLAERFAKHRALR